MTVMAEPGDLYAFDITLHGRMPGVIERPPAESHADAWGTWPTLAVSHDVLTMPMEMGFDEAFGRLGMLERMYAEPDADLKGSCPEAEFDRLVGAFGWPRQQMMMQLVRPAVFLDESTFRRHARARGIAGDGQTLRPL